MHLAWAIKEFPRFEKSANPFSAISKPGQLNILASNIQ